MKVLFAVHDEKVTLSIVKKYQKEYKEIISYKNVYYFNAIIKELQRDKNYDRIVIDEELEEFTSSSYEQKDKFIFDKLDNITDEASNTDGNDIPIILICSERRVKSEEIFVKFFGIGIYNAIIGNDRSTDEVCRLINKPRSKKDAKVYYRIDSDEVNYKHENEDDVSEEEMQYILSYFKKLGKNEEKYVDCFRNIVSQYNENQLRIIISILPLHVRSVLEESSPEYQKLVATNRGYTPNKNVATRKPEKAGTSEVLLTDKRTSAGKPIVVPSKIDNSLIKKVTIRKPTMPKVQEEIEEEEPDIEDILEDIVPKNIPEEDDMTQEDDFEEEIFEEKEVQQEPVKRGRGRPRKNPVVEETEPKVPKKRGRPRKNPIIEEENITLPGFDEIEDKDEDKTMLPGFDDDYEDEQENDDIGFSNYKNTFEEDEEDEEEEDNVLPGFGDDYEDEQEDDDYTETPRYEEKTQHMDFNPKNNMVRQRKEELPENNYQDFDYTEYNQLLSSTRKTIAFVGTSKNGTSFIVNNIAKILSNNGIDTAILDATQNKNAYYIYTKNEEELRQQAASSIEKLVDGRAEGVRVRNNLTVYTELPNVEPNIQNVGPILDTLIKSHSAVLIDCDFNTPIEYFDKAQEIYLVQSMDILTIQPLTAFLRELKGKMTIDENKIRIILNKVVRVRGVSSKTIVGGMSYYNDPEMSFMTELFNRNMITPIEIPFDLNVYERYLEQIVDCEITTDKYPKDFQTILSNLASVIYPLLPAKSSKAKKGYQYDVNTDNYSNNGFSNSVNNTLNDMKKKIR